MILLTARGPMISGTLPNGTKVTMAFDPERSRDGMGVLLWLQSKQAEKPTDATWPAVLAWQQAQRKGAQRTRRSAPGGAA